MNNPDLFEGDMILTAQQTYNAKHGLDVDIPGRKRGSSIFTLWPRGVVVYEIEPRLGRLL